MPVQYSSTRRIDSSKYPGVVYTLRKPNEKRRAELMRSLSSLLDKERDMQRRFAAIQERQTVVKNEDGTEKIDPETCEAVKEFKNPDDIKAITDVVQELNDFRVLEVNPIYLRWGLSKIEDLEIDGRPANIDDLLGDDAPEGLVEEILDALQGKTDLSPELKKRSESASTSDDQSPEMPVTNADTANSSETL